MATPAMERLRQLQEEEELFTQAEQAVVGEEEISPAMARLQQLQEEPSITERVEEPSIEEDVVVPTREPLVRDLAVNFPGVGEAKPDITPTPKQVAKQGGNMLQALVSGPEYLLSPITRPLSRGLENLVDAYADIAGVDYGPGYVPPIGTPLVDPLTMSTQERGAQVLGEVAGGGLGLSRGAIQGSARLLRGPAEKGVNYLGSRFAAGPGALEASVNRIIQNKALRADPNVQRYLKPSWSEAGGAIPAWFLDGPVRAYAHNPKAALAIEDASVFGAATLASMFTMHKPDAPAHERMAAEVAGGVLSPFATGYRFALGASKGTQNIFRRAFASGRQDVAASAWADLIENRARTLAGEEGLDESDAARRAVHDVVRSIERATPEELEHLSAGQISRNEVLLGGENLLARRSAKFADRRKKDTLAFLKSMRDEADALVATGNVNDLENAVRLRKTKFDDMLNSNLSYHRTRLMGRIANMFPQGEAASTPGELIRLKGRLGQEVQSELYQQVQYARQLKADLWEAAPNDIQMGPDANIGSTIASLRQRMTESTKLPMEKDLLKLSQEGGTSGEYIGAMNDLSDIAGRAFENNQFNLYHRANRLQSAVEKSLLELPEDAVDDITRVGGDEVAKLSKEQLERAQTADTIRTAKLFTQRMHEHFDDTIVSKIIAPGQQEGFSVAPEDVLIKIFNPDHPIASERHFRQIGGASQFLNSMYGFDPEVGSSILYQEETFFRSLAAEFRQQDGTVDHEGLWKFIDENRNVLELMPALRLDVVDAESAARTLTQLEERSANISRQTAQKAAFANIVGSNDPAGAVSGILGGKNFMQDYTQLASVVRRVKDEVPKGIEGLRAATVESAYNRSRTGGEGGVSFQRLQQELWGPMRRDQISLVDLMKREGVLSDEAEKQMKRFVDEAAFIEGTLKDPARIEDFLAQQKGTVSSHFRDFVLRVAGAVGPGLVARKAGVELPAAGSLVIAGAGSKLARHFGSDVPVTRQVEAMMELIENPRMLSEALKEHSSMESKIEGLRTLNAFLINAGLPAQDPASPILGNPIDPWDEPGSDIPVPFEEGQQRDALGELETIMQELEELSSENIELERELRGFRTQPPGR